MTNSCAETETTLALKVVRRDLKEENRVRDKIGPSVWVESERTHDFWNDEKEEARLGSKNYIFFSSTCSLLLVMLVWLVEGWRKETILRFLNISRASSRSTRAFDCERFSFCSLCFSVWYEI